MVQRITSCEIHVHPTVRLAVVDQNIKRDCETNSFDSDRRKELCCIFHAKIRSKLRRPRYAIHSQLLNSGEGSAGSEEAKE